MSALTMFHNASSREVAWARVVGAASRHWLWALALALSVLIGTYEAHRALEAPGAAIRRDLVRAGADVANLSWSTPRERVEQAVSRQFSGYRASVDASQFPVAVTVTLHDLDRADCRAVRDVTARIEGDVVIAMERSSGAACQERTSITWRIMP